MKRKSAPATINSISDFTELINNMREALGCLNDLPENHKINEGDLAQLDDIRHDALRLADCAEEFIQEFEERVAQLAAKEANNART
jgi:hypothetical protein